MKLTKNKIGDERRVKRFAYLPTRLTNGIWIWLEKYESRERYEVVDYLLMVNGWECKYKSELESK